MMTNFIKHKGFNIFVGNVDYLKMGSVPASDCSNKPKKKAKVKSDDKAKD